MDNSMLVRFDNSFNTLFPSNFTKTEMNAFMYLVSVLSRSTNDEITLDYKKIREIIAYNPKRTSQDFDEVLAKLSYKLSDLVLTLTDDDSDTDLRVFPTFTRDSYNRKLTIGINPKAKHLFKSCSGYTQFDLQEYVSISSKHAKAMFIFLKQFRSTGIWHIRIDDFKKRVGVTSFSNNNCIQKCVYPAIDELNEKGIFTNLTVTVEHSNEQGSPICALLFKFKPEIMRKKKDDNGSLNTKETKEKSDSIDIFSMPEAFQSIYFTAEAMLKGLISEKNIFAITEEAMKYRLEPVTLKRIINTSISRDGVENIVGYIISLIRRTRGKANNEKTAVPSKIPAKSTNSFHNFSEREYDYNALFSDICAC